MDSSPVFHLKLYHLWLPVMGFDAPLFVCKADPQTMVMCCEIAGNHHNLGEIPLSLPTDSLPPAGCSEPDIPPTKH